MQNHKIKLHLTEALQYHEKLEELQKVFETAKQLLQEHLDNLKKQNMSQDNPDNPIDVQNIEAGEAILGKKQEIDISEMSF